MFVWRLSAHRHNGGDVAARAPELARKLAQRVVRTLSQKTSVRPIPTSLPSLSAPPVPQQQPPATLLDIDNSTKIHQSDPHSTTSQASAVLPEEDSPTSHLVEPGIVHSPLGYDRTSLPHTPVGETLFNESTQHHSGSSVSAVKSGLHHGSDYSRYRGNDDNGGFDDSWGAQQIKRDAPRNVRQQTLDRADNIRMSSGSSGSSGSGHGGKRQRTPPKGRKPPRSANSSTKPSDT